MSTAKQQARTSEQQQEPEAEDGLPANAIFTTLAEFQSGDFAAECSERLAELAKLVRNRGDAGELTIKIKLKPKGKQIVATPDLSVKEPKKDHGVNIFYATDHGQLVREDPEQRQLDFDGRPKIAGGK